MKAKLKRLWDRGKARLKELWGKHRFRRTCVIAIGILVTVILMILSICYDMKENQNSVTMISALWSAAATTALGGIAIWQNKRYKELSDEKNSQSEKLMFTPECYLQQVTKNKMPGLAWLSVTPGKGYHFIQIVSCFCSLNQPMLETNIESVKEIDIDNPANNRLFLKKELMATAHGITVFQNYSMFQIGVDIPVEYENTNISCEITLAYQNIYHSTIHKTVVIRRLKNGYLDVLEQRQAEIVGKANEEK